MKQLILCMAALLVIGCAGSGADRAVSSESDEFLVRSTTGKADTGYLSSLASELEGVYAGQIRLDGSTWTDEQREARLAELERIPFQVRQLIDNQLKFAKSQLNEAKLHINLSSGQQEQAFEKRIEGQDIVIDFSVRVESIVTHHDLDEQGLTIEDLQDTSVDVLVPRDPMNMKARYGDACAEGIDASHLDEHNYFYYFAPNKEGCTAPLTTATFAVHSLLPSKITYPEYDQLTADGVLKIAVYAGIGNSERYDGMGFDWGMDVRDIVVFGLRARRFEVVESEDTVGVRLSRHENGLTTQVDVVGPEDIYPLTEPDRLAVFARMILEYEVVMYNGHSFYGSLNVLDGPNNFPANRYQVFFMNSCWSYEYYTKQIFRAKRTDADPEGWLLADVVNNTEVGWANKAGQLSMILLVNLIAGTELQGVDRAESRFYTWANIIGAMNDYAKRAFTPGGKPHEIYGVSGVTSNVFEPAPTAAFD